ncbi:3-hydroxyacyl-CoA dehydrogenase [Savagea faecisuis]|uniref:3-hydroxyacyl-CoA dehydrogenase n=1 Tax=Savagea faecisuis TaxID=1274803 RepID=A0ABW3H3I6_9BACL
MNYQHVTVAGGGVLGSQIAMQTAYFGYDVTLYDISEEAIAQAKERTAALNEPYRQDLKATDEQLQAAHERLTYTSDLAEAVKEADLVIEAIPEVIEIKVDFYEKIATLAPEHTVFVTNTSTLLPSQFAQSTGRPAQFLALHFANHIWRNNTAEVMGHAETAQQHFDDVVEFAKSIGMVALPLHKEQPGYILNSLLVPLLDAAELLYVNDVANPETIDKTWMIGTGAPLGPFAILDVIGINTAYNIVQMKAQVTKDDNYIRLAQLLKEQYIDQGKLGRETGEGFYKYPNPSFADPNFLK